MNSVEHDTVARHYLVTGWQLQNVALHDVAKVILQLKIFERWIYFQVF